MDLHYWASWWFHVKLVLRLAIITLLMDFLPYLLKLMTGVDVVASMSSGPVLQGAALLTTTAAVVASLYWVAASQGFVRGAGPPGVVTGTVPK